MPALAFGLKTAKTPSGPPKPPQKRKAIFSQEQDDENNGDDDDAFGNLANGPKKAITGGTIQQNELSRPSKSSKLAQPQSSSNASAKYSNLSALRSAKLQDEKASKLDASVYDYDAVYETFHADKQKKDSDGSADQGPKYMNSLLASADVRKRDQLRAKEKLLQKERDAEGDEFADKEKFVTGAYKKQQEEIKRMEEEEKKREEEEELRRIKGGGMTAFHKDLLKKDEERQRAMDAAAEEAKRRRDAGESSAASDPQNNDDKTDAKIAEELNQKGAHIVVNDEGDVVDRRQLLTAGLNVVRKSDASSLQKAPAMTSKAQDWQRSAKAQDARLSQRERQSRMMERQIEEINAKQQLAELGEMKEREEKNKTQVSEADKMGARERFLQRKKEREEAAKKAKAS